MSQIMEREIGDLSFSTCLVNAFLVSMNLDPVLSLVKIYSPVVSSSHNLFKMAATREELKDFVTFVDKVYLPFAREHHSSSTHDEFRGEVMKDYFKTKRFDEITIMLVVKFINERLNSHTVRLLSSGRGRKEASRSLSLLRNP